MEVGKLLIMSTSVLPRRRTPEVELDTAGAEVGIAAVVTVAFGGSMETDAVVAVAETLLRGDVGMASDDVDNVLGVSEIASAHNKRGYAGYQSTCCMQ